MTDYIRMAGWGDYVQHPDRANRWRRQWGLPAAKDLLGPKVASLKNYEFTKLNDRTRFEICVMLDLALTLDNRIPYDIKKISRLLDLELPVDIPNLISLGYVEVCNIENKVIQEGITLDKKSLGQDRTGQDRTGQDTPQAAGIAGALNDLKYFLEHPSEVVARLHLEDGTRWPVTYGLLAEFCDVYGKELDLAEEVKKLALYLVANKDKRPKSKPRRSLTNWLSNALKFKRRDDAREEARNPRKTPPPAPKAPEFTGEVPGLGERLELEQNEENES